MFYLFIYLLSLQSIYPSHAGYRGQPNAENGNGEQNILKPLYRKDQEDSLRSMQLCPRYISAKINLKRPLSSLT